MSERRLSVDEAEELASLNEAVNAAISRRRQWLDRKMDEVSSLKVGDGIYDLLTGDRLGTVSELYRYHSKRNPLEDTGLAIDYVYEVRPRFFSNTSSQMRPSSSFGTAEEARQRLANMAKMAFGWRGARSIFAIAILILAPLVMGIHLLAGWRLVSWAWVGP